MTGVQTCALPISLQGEAAGAQAFSDFDTLLAPFIRADKLSYDEVKQALQELSYPLLIPTTSMPLYIAVLTTLLIAAFIPGASPPLVKTPILCISTSVFHIICTQQFLYFK